MKLFDVDWLGFFKRLAVWNRLTLSTRQFLAQLKSNTAVNAGEFGNDLQPLANARFLLLYADGRRAKLHKDCLSFACAIRAMCRHDILNQPDVRMLSDYIRDHFTYAEQAALSPDGPSYHGDAPDLARDAMSVRWLNDFLALKNIEQAQEWESRRRQNAYYHMRDSEELILDSSKVLTAIQSIIRQFMSSTEPVSFGELSGRFKRLGLPLLAAATYAGIRYLLLFPSMRHDDMTPMVTLWPPLLERHQRPKAKPPRAVTPEQTTLDCAYLMEDMTTVLVGASGEPPRIRSSDHALFAKAREQLESSLLSIPEWLAQTVGCTPGRRVATALEFLQAFRLIETRGTLGKDLRMEPTAEAREWLGRSGKDRLRSILDRLKAETPRKSEQPYVPAKDDVDTDDAEHAARFAREMLRLAELDDEDDDDDDYNSPFMSDGYDHRLGFLPQTVSLGFDAACDLDIPGALIDAYGSLARRRFVAFSQFVEYHTRQANPLLSLHLAAEPRNVQISWSRRNLTDEKAEQLWSQLLVDFFCLRLLPLGGAQVGLTGTAGDLCIALTDAGRYLLELTKDFDYGQHHDQQGHIVVQPNFDIVFLSPDPLAEATIARFAERTGNGTGTLFRITMKSVFAAASTDMTAEQVLGTLRDTSTKAIPSNVRSEIQGWFDRCGRVAIKSAVLIHCPDVQTASRVLAAGGKKLASISDTVLELVDHKFKAPLVKKLKETGVFVDQSSQPAVRRPKRRRRRRW